MYFFSMCLVCIDCSEWTSWGSCYTCTNYYFQTAHFVAFCLIIMFFTSKFLVQKWETVSLKTQNVWVRQHFDYTWVTYASNDNSNITLKHAVIVALVCRYNRGVQKDEKLHLHESLDRRRLEEAFLLYAVLKMHFLYNLEIDHVDYDRNTLVEKVTETFRQKFLESWSGKLIKFSI